MNECEIKCDCVSREEYEAVCEELREYKSALEKVEALYEEEIFAKAELRALLEPFSRTRFGHTEDAWCRIEFVEDRIPSHDFKVSDLQRAWNRFNPDWPSPVATFRKGQSNE